MEHRLFHHAPGADYGRINGGKLYDDAAFSNFWKRCYPIKKPTIRSTGCFTMSATLDKPVVAIRPRPVRLWNAQPGV
jgi:hypothetical protein